ncbi:hypothetical protein AVEN_76937-1 [Araneus ventricosus]|uniref:Uncharacterized protein n=1 Tax=Araneus ventricosus TaxID=182803 RepID=A0A4Y2FH07_ARAVE|nr:hypothetical protein AVEN_76937-1 [Araneus ventricosus]
MVKHSLDGRKQHICVMTTTAKQEFALQRSPSLLHPSIWSLRPPRATLTSHCAATFGRTSLFWWIASERILTLSASGHQLFSRNINSQLLFLQHGEIGPVVEVGRLGQSFILRSLSDMESRRGQATIDDVSNDHEVSYEVKGKSVHCLGLRSHIENVP